MPGTFRIGKIAGIDIDIHVSWIIILVFLTVSLDTGWFPQLYPGWSTATYWLIAFLSSLLLFVSVLLHELAHSLVARRRGLPVKSITLFIFGGVSNIEREPQSPGVEFQIAFVGPLTSLVIGAICFLLQVPLRGSNSPLEGILFYLAVTNILLGVFNLIPGFPLDGGRVLRSIVWRLTGNLRQATRVASLTGQVIAYLFILLGIWIFFVGDILDGIWFGFIGWFLLSAAQSANAQGMLTSVLSGVTVGEVMNPKPATVPADISLQQLVDAYFLPGGLRYALVMQADHLVGLITLGDIRHIPREQWGQVPVSTAMIPLSRLHVVTPQQSLSDVLPLMAGRDVNQLPVLENDALVGILSRDAIVHYLEVRRSLGVENAQSDAHNHLSRAA
ncbi:MAG TPA: site-2 protease family protein [Ktedonobacteraceae bacterium]|nr:site-2 protease family protein [Ktedonobacteraceae bacterium]